MLPILEAGHRSPAAPSLSSFSTVEPALGQPPTLVTILFNHLLKSSQSGAAALRETSSGLRKQQSVSIPTEHFEVDRILIIRTGSLTFKAVHNAKYDHGEGEPFPFPFCCLPYMQP